MTQLEDKLFALVMAAMTGQTFDAPLTDDDWRWLYRAAARQSMVGLCFTNRADMPKDVAMSWAVDSARGRPSVSPSPADCSTAVTSSSSTRSAAVSTNRPSRRSMPASSPPIRRRPCSSSPTAPPSGNCVTRWSDFKP